MASGRLGAASVPATTNTTVYTVPAGKTASLSLCLCNRTGSAVTARVALSAAAAPTDAEWIEYDVSIPSNGVLERSGLALSATQNVVVYASAAALAAVVCGFEE